MNDVLKIYIDGSCVPNPGKGGWSFVILNDHENLIHYEIGSALAATNNRMELNALIQALRFCEKHQAKANIYSDSMLVVNTFNNWIYTWKRKGWKRKKEKRGEIANLDLVKELYQIKQQVDHLVTLEHVQGHSGIKGNELADYYAGLARKKHE